MEILTSINLTDIATKFLIAIAVAIAGKLVLSAIEKNMSKLKIDMTLGKFLLTAAKLVVYFIAIMIVAGSFGFEMSSLVALASVVSAAFALAASGVLSNLFGGVLLLITKPFGVGDYIIVAGNEGIVQEVGLVATLLNTVDNKRIVLPNSTVVNSTIVNCSTEGKRRVDLVFNLGYENDGEKVRNAIRTAAAAHAKVLDKEAIFVRTSAYNASDVSYTLRAWCATADYWDVYFDLMEQVKAQLDREGLRPAYPHVTVVNK